MRHASDIERRRKEEEASLKRQRIADDATSGYGYAGPSSVPGPSTFAAPDAKRRRLQDGPEVSATPPLSSSQPLATAGLEDFDIKSLKADLVLELILANMQVMTAERVQAAVQVSANVKRGH